MWNRLWKEEEIKIPKTIERLTNKFVETIAKPGKYNDGLGLYLIVSENGKSWVFRYQHKAKEKRSRWMGIGGVADMPLKMARELVVRLRREIRLEERDPIEERRERREKAKTPVQTIPTFAEAANDYISTHERSWSNPVHRRQWRQSLDDYAIPVMGKRTVDTIDSKLVAQALMTNDLWLRLPETGRRVRARIENIMQSAISKNGLGIENPAAWDRLKPLLPAQKDMVKHHAALPWPQIPDFMARLAAVEGIAPLALRFTILTAARTGEVIGATWREIDLVGKCWVIPAHRMKMKREHRVPLCDAAIEILRTVMPAAMRSGVPAPDAPIFPGWRAGAHLSNMAMAAVLKRIDRPDLTVHGTARSSFRDWVSEATEYQGEVAEAALAHLVSSKVEAAYRRGDLFEKRRRMMQDWGEYCTISSVANDPSGATQEDQQAAA